MKKLFLGIIMCGIFLISGCGKYTEDDIIKDLTKKIENAKAYEITGTMEITNNEDVYTYSVNVGYMEKDNYKISLMNLANDHEQVILRNSDGVYVVTPSLNKSFKFQSDWPYNNSQVYLLGSILEDLTSDDNRKFEENDDGYLFTSSVNYPNNQKLVKQRVYMDKKLNISEVNVLDENDNTQIKMVFDKIDLKAKFNDNYFDLDQLVKEENNSSSNSNTDSNNTNNTNTDKENTNSNTNNNTNSNTNSNTNTDNNSETGTDSSTDTQSSSTEETKTTATIEDVIYPMYLPTNTYLTNQETVETEDGERLILTFGGDNPFMLIEETVNALDEHLIVPTSGDFDLLVDTIGVVSDNSINWVSNGIEYYVISDVVETSELLEVARSISVLPVSK